jgi:hypothetical protein
MKKDEGLKYDDGKLRWDLFPENALCEVAKVFTEGSNKYGERNWEKGIVYGRLYAASRRHLSAFIQGERIDEIGTHHLANAIVNLMMMLSFELDGRDKELDNLTKQILKTN